MAGSARIPLLVRHPHRIGLSQLAGTSPAALASSSSRRAWTSASLLNCGAGVESWSSSASAVLFRLPGTALLHTRGQSLRMSERHFEDVDHAKVYSLYRPVPPESLVDRVVHFVGRDRRTLCLDVGCGSGQSSLCFSPHFDRVVGVDVSPSQIEEAKAALRQHDVSNVEYRVGGEKTWPFESSSVDLVSACQAIHWFDIPAFYTEANRVLKPGGVIAVIGYDFTDPAPSVKNYKELAALRAKIYSETKKYWSPLRDIVDQRYTTIPQIPYEDGLRDDSHWVESDSSLEGLAGYIQTWSGFQKLKKEEGDDTGQQVIQKFLDGAKILLEVPQEAEPSSVPLKLRTSYFLLMGKKPKDDSV